MINHQLPNNIKIQNSKFQKFIYFNLIIGICLIIGVWLLVIRTEAQGAISLSVSPPLFELMIQPDKDVKQIFTITNLGGDSFITPKIVYFTPNGKSGNVDLTEDESPNWIIYDKTPFTLKSQGKLDFEVTFSPPVNTEETDHLLTLIFETSEPIDLLNQNSSSYKSRIGTNILLTISKDGNPKKSAEIIEFSSPRVVDSFLSPIRYSLLLSNNGNSYWKPNGKIIVNGEILNLAPLNILSGHSRIINCIDNENLIDCKLKNKFRIGKIISKLEFSIDEEAKIYQGEAVTYAFPFSILGIILTLLTILKYKYKFILTLWPKIKH